MWRKVSEEQSYLERAITFTSNAELYGNYMQRVTSEWPMSCEQNLTDLSINRKAWIGHAAACLAIESPEYITRMAWAYLSNEQQRNANKQADNAIAAWEARHANIPMDQLCLKLT